MEINKKQHWENVFATKKETEVSWYQEKPETSLQFFERNKIPKTSKILEIGGGDSYLIDNLLEQGYESLTLLDISENAIERIKKRLGEKAEKVRFVVSDILDFSPSEKFDVIHDRASFHFLTKEEDIQKYATLMNDILETNGLYFVGTFSESGQVFPVEEGSVVRVSPDGKRSVRNNGTTPLVMLCVQYRGGTFTAEDATDGVILNEPVKW
jgi:ubiquinone/menaquinone biosynthesis C-methylase UbiE